MGVDPWLPTSPPRPPTVLNEHSSELPVQLLIDQHTKQWDEIKLAAYIDPSDHYLIRKIYLPQTDESDNYLWNLTTDGQYKVKSGYWQALTMTRTEDTPQAPLATTPDIAANIWKLDISPKLKHFLWRMASRALGVADNLRRRNIHVIPYCSICCTELETSEHLFFSCTNSIAIWRTLGISTTMLSDPAIAVDNKLRYLFNIHQDHSLPQISSYAPFWLLWYLWKSRNNLVFNHKMMDQNVISTQILSDVEEWITNTSPQSDEGHEVHRARSQGTKWTPPDQRWVKCNYDASHHDGDRNSGLGWILRTTTGAFLEAGMGKFQGRATIEESEYYSIIR
ncbi:PREDICTED: uncharacterized protein LOC104779182 [Camelina sativa]|uniref:Uncharacterized protein LOC104779182 n=1 Tax=Camelina sativa TaxID=90675 RepID=A0ABM0YJC9_CAMSA|nr:PREDICTED: uncharacterized protein LOC104779182 [Camelina sativa]